MNKIYPTLCMFLALLAALVVGPSSSADPAVMDGFPPSAESQVTKANYLAAPFNRWAFRNAGAPLHGVM
ncbi:MAG: 6-aminohexanoate hydrolase, partial [Cellvibrionales bacterium]